MAGWTQEEKDEAEGYVNIKGKDKRGSRKAEKKPIACWLRLQKIKQKGGSLKKMRQMS